MKRDLDWNGTLRITSCMAPCADHICFGVSRYLSERLNIRIEFINDIPWQERERLFYQGELDICWLCGLPYVWKSADPSSQVELLAAPVMSGKRYRDQPVYFSDVVVRRDSVYRSFGDLRGSRWAYNEPRSQSGYNVVKHHLRSIGETLSYFGRVIESGAHQASLQMLLSAEADVSVIDSTVLEHECRRNTDLLDQIRVIDSLGPSPIPPWVIWKGLPATLKHNLRHALIDMHKDSEGAAILAEGAIARFASVNDRDYDAIRRMNSETSR